MFLGSLRTRCPLTDKKHWKSIQKILWLITIILKWNQMSLSTGHMGLLNCLFITKMMVVHTVELKRHVGSLPGITEVVTLLRCCVSFSCVSMLFTMQSQLVWNKQTKKIVVAVVLAVYFNDVKSRNCLMPPIRAMQPYIFFHVTQYLPCFHIIVWPPIMLIIHSVTHFLQYVLQTKHHLDPHIFCMG